MASSARLDELKKKFEENPRRYFAPLANEHRKSGDVDQAIALCRTHLPQQPGHISGHIVLAQALFEAGSLDESREIFHSALGLDPENLIALRYLGDIAKEARDLDTARSWYQRVLEVDPRNEEIEQLIRDLDAPPPAVEEASEEERVAETSAFAPPATAPTPPPAATPAEPDARFAPLSIEEVEIDDSFGAPSPDAQPNDAVSQSRADAPVLEAPELDQFDLDPSGSIDALLDMPATPSVEEFFLADLSGAHATSDGAEPEASPAQNSWTPPETPAEPPTAEVVTEDLSTLGDEVFQLEPPPPEPAVSAEHDVVTNVASESGVEASESPDQMAIPGMDAFAAEYSTGSFEAIPEPEPNDDAIEQFASQQTAEWHPPAPPAAAVDDGLGLEVMEFVPPSSEPPVRAAIPEAPDADPVLGRTLAMPTNEPSQPPAAFVTETMAELYLQQGFRNEALAVYRELLTRNPADTSLRDRIDQIERGSVSSIGMASVSEEVVESAIKRHAGRPPRSVRSFFASLAGRRAPAPREPAHTELPSEAALPTIDESSSQPEAVTSAEPIALEHVSTDADVPAKPGLAARPARTTPIPSAAETLASFDPFAQASEAEPLSRSGLDAAAAPNEPFAEFSTGLKASSRQTPLSTPAQTPASVFGQPEPQGRPTRAASNELSLDHVFRGAPEAAPAADGGFSFDQFFSDSRGSGDDAAAAATAPESGRAAGSADAHDIEQFTAWLEGLKKK